MATRPHENEARPVARINVQASYAILPWASEWASFVTPAIFVVAECFEVGQVEVADASGELRVVDGGERHRLRRVEDPPRGSDHFRWGVEPTQDVGELLAEAFEPADDVIARSCRYCGSSQASLDFHAETSRLYGLRTNLKRR
jgi:hypothetical protein